MWSQYLKTAGNIEFGVIRIIILLDVLMQAVRPGRLLQLCQEVFLPGLWISPHLQ